MNRSAGTLDAVPLAKASLSRPPATITTPPESPLLLSEEPSTPSLPISPPATISIDPSPHAHKADSLPQAVLNVLHPIRDRNRGKPSHSDSSWKRVTLSPEEYELLQNVLVKEDLRGWVKDKLRFDYDSLRGEIVLRMPSPIHCMFVEALKWDIQRQLDGLRFATQQDATQQDRQEINCALLTITAAGTSDIYFPAASGHDKKSPDGSFRFKGQKYPPIVLEISYSQRRKELPALAEYYINYSLGAIKTVITVDIEYRRSGKHPATTPVREAVYSVYRHRIVKNEETGHISHREAHPDIEDQPFRLKDGAIPDGSLELWLSDFCPPGALNDGNDRSITITHERLAAILAKGEEGQTEMESLANTSNKHESQPEIPFISKRKRSPTPKLTDEHEVKFQAVEDEVNRRNSEEDSTYAATSSFSSAEEAMPQRPKRIKP